MVKQVLLTASLLMGVGAAVQAQAPTDRIIVQTAGDQQNAFKFTDISRITFSNGQMSVEPKAGGENQVFTLSNIERMFFATTTSGVKEVKDETEMRVVLSDGGNELKLAGVAEPAPAAIYNLNGTLLASQAQWDGSSLDISALGHGVYVLHFGNKTFKFIK